MGVAQTTESPKIDDAGVRFGSTDARLAPFKLAKVVPQLRERGVPEEFISILETSAKRSEELCRRVEEVDPNGRFGYRVFHHCFDLVSEGLEVAERLRLSGRETGVLVAGLFLEDAFGRPAAQLGRDSYVDFLPEGERGNEAWFSVTRAHTRHGDLGVYLIKGRSVLTMLPQDEQDTICAIVRTHAQSFKDFVMSRDDPAFRFCLIGRELDQLELVTQTTYMQAPEALAQFVQWGAERCGLTHTAARAWLKENDSGRAAALSIIDAVLKGNSPPGIAQSEQQEPVLKAIEEWFKKPASKDLLQLFGQWGRGETETVPNVQKEDATGNRSREVTFSYANYMLSQIAAAIQLSPTLTMMTPEGLLSHPQVLARFQYIVSLDQAAEESIQSAFKRALAG